MFLIDSHCHLDQLDYCHLHQDVDDVLEKARAVNVRLTLAVCTTLSGFEKMITMIGQREDVLFSCGIHPLHLVQEEYPYDYLSEMRRFVVSKSVVAIGETGLDYYYQQDNKKKQQEVFRQHIRLGREWNKPVIVHSRRAGKDTLAILREEKANECGGVLHCFSEDCNTAKMLLDLGFYISFSGIITFRNTAMLRDVANYVPFDRLLVETDSPYLAPVPYRGKENQPAYVKVVAQCLAVLKGVTLENMADTTTNNFSQLFHVDIP